MKPDGSADVAVYSLGKGNTYLKRFRRATESQKDKGRVEIRAAAAEARVRGALESEKVVKKRLDKMGMHEEEVMTYRLGGGPLWYSCWGFLRTKKRLNLVEQCDSSR